MMIATPQNKQCSTNGNYFSHSLHSGRDAENDQRGRSPVASLRISVIIPLFHGRIYLKLPKYPQHRESTPLRVPIDIFPARPMRVQRPTGRAETDSFFSTLCPDTDLSRLECPGGKSKSHSVQLNLYRIRYETGSRFEFDSYIEWISFRKMANAGLCANPGKISNSRSGPALRRFESIESDTDWIRSAQVFKLTR